MKNDNVKLKKNKNLASFWLSLFIIHSQFLINSEVYYRSFKFDDQQLPYSQIRFDQLLAKSDGFDRRHTGDDTNFDHYFGLCYFKFGDQYFHQKH